ncbi:MAG TPA: hypothetical protein VK891_09400 [Euzebyales bacterium]|nr:hypothetical protein [Euzebyales bacterium]
MVMVGGVMAMVILLPLAAELASAASHLLPADCSAEQTDVIACRAGEADIVISPAQDDAAMPGGHHALYAGARPPMRRTSS